MKNTMKIIVKTTAATNNLDSLKNAFKYRELVINLEWLYALCPGECRIWFSGHKTL